MKNTMTITAIAMFLSFPAHAQDMDRINDLVTKQIIIQKQENIEKILLNNGFPPEQAARIQKARTFTLNQQLPKGDGGKK